MGPFTAPDPSVAKALMDTLPVPKKLVLCCLAGREVEGEERCGVGWVVLSSSLPGVNDGWSVLRVKSLVFSRTSRNPDPWSWACAVATKCLIL